MIYCLNVFDREQILRENIETIVKMLNPEFIFVSSNGLKDFSCEYPRVHFRNFGPNQGWQLGALNGMLDSLRFACETISNIEDHVVIFSHDDILPCNEAEIDYLCGMIEPEGFFDMVARHYVPDNYTMIENLIMSGRMVKACFSNIELINQNDFGSNGAERWFTNFIGSSEIEFKSILLGFQKNFDMRENEMGFIHKHEHSK
jgi:hypothetical protein